MANCCATSAAAPIYIWPTHLTRTHGITADRYRVAHGLPMTQPLVAARVRRRMAKAWEANRATHLDALARTRDPQRARASRRTVPHWTAAARAARLEGIAGRRGRRLTTTEMRYLGDDLAPDEWCRRVRMLLAGDATVSIPSIARSFNMSESWAYRRLRRHPSA